MAIQNNKPTRISQLETLSIYQMKTLLDHLYIPIAYSNGEDSANYKLPLKYIINMINESGCKCMNNLEENFSRLLKENIDDTWHIIDKLPKMVSLSFDNDNNKIKIRISNKINANIRKNTYKVNLYINSILDSNVGITIYDVLENKQDFLKEIYLTSNNIELEIDEGINFSINMIELIDYIEYLYPNRLIKFYMKNQTIEQEITKVFNDEYNSYEAWTTPIQIYDDEEIFIESYIKPYISFNEGGANGVKELILDGEHIPIAALDNKYIKYNTEHKLECVLYSNYYINNENGTILNFDNHNYKFNVYQKPYTKFNLVAFNGDIYDGTSKCSLLPEALITDIQKYNGYYNANTLLNDIITESVQSKLRYGGFYTVYNPIYYISNTLDIINTLDKENKDIDIILKQNTSIVQINVIDTDNITSSHTLPLKQIINFETLFSDEKKWDTSDITCLLNDSNKYKFDIQFEDINGNDVKSKLLNIIEISETDKEFKFKFKQSPSVLPTTSDKYSNLCSYNITFSIKIGTKLR